MVKAKLERQQQVEQAVKLASPTVRQALTSTLKYNEEEPDWWETYVKEKASHEDYPSTPELVDVIDTPLGKAAVVWESQSNRNSSLTKDSGMYIDLLSLRLMDSGEEVGYINNCYINEGSYKASFGDDEFTEFRYHKRYSGSYINLAEVTPERVEEGKVTEEELEAVRNNAWLRITQSGIEAAGYRGGYQTENGWVSGYQVGEKHTPLKEQRDADLDRYRSYIRKEMDKKEAYFKDPFIDYSNIDDRLKGKGLGTAMYIYSARKLAQTGRRLRGSGLQSDEAGSVWARFKTNLPAYFKTGALKKPYSGAKTEVVYLDFRD
jgi:hypothetical protein